ncbi:RNA polymerase subunit sigma-70, partial [Streptomyces sp. PAL114]|nr:RNA polymerase subunit sigma-70 [Streptomyces sp. PAL114]
MRSEDGPVRDEERGTRELPAERVPDGIDGIPEQARPHPEDDPAEGAAPGGRQGDGAAPGTSAAGPAAPGGDAPARAEPV